MTLDKLYDRVQTYIEHKTEQHRAKQQISSKKTAPDKKKQKTSATTK